MEIKNWPMGVNRIVLSDSTPTHNKNAVVSDKSENGNEMSRLSASGSPDDWRINMIFSNSRENSFFKKTKRMYEEGKLPRAYTEWEYFDHWFKYTVAMGTVPFYFTKVGDTTEESTCVYRFKPEGMPTYTFNGNIVRASMTWTEVFNDFITVNIDEPHVDSLAAYNGYVEVWYSDKPDVTPKKSQFSFTYAHDAIKNEPLVMEDFIFDGNKSCVFYYPEFTDNGVYEIILTQTYTDADGNKVTKELFDRFEV